ncbi:MAG: transcriptional repressor [Clostridia bacterium]|nr:transcriptional repressor [Clostridia bacterium]
MRVYHTQQRKILIDFLQKNHNKSFTIEEIMSSIGESGISQSTAYRLITKLVEDGIVSRSVRGTGRSFVYQYINNEKCEGHLHMKCTGCGKVYHLDSGITSIIQNDIKSSANFEIDSHTVLLGKCNTCKE